MSNFAQNFERDDAGDWHWTTGRPLMHKARARFDLSVYGCWEEEHEDAPVIEVTINGMGPDAVSASHEAAWDYLLCNCDTIERFLRAELLKHHNLGWSGFQRDVTDETEGWDDVRGLIDWASESAIDHLYELQSIHLGPDERDGYAMVTFHFASSWDTEHGVDVSLCRDAFAN